MVGLLCNILIRFGVQIGQGVERLVACIYTHLFRQHCRGDDFESVMRSLKGSRLSARYQKLLPSYGRAACTLKNANFVLRYWTGGCMTGAEARSAGFGFCVRPDNSIDWDENAI